MAVTRLAAGPFETLQQEDVFFRSTRGPLKLRILSDSEGQLIYYERPDAPEATQSDYQIYRTSRPQALRAALSCALGETVVVKKTREVYLVGQTRIHLDEVEKLGPFIELELVLRRGQDAEEGRRIVDDLMARLCIRQADLVAGAYADLLLKRAEQSSPTDSAEEKDAPGSSSCQ